MSVSFGYRNDGGWMNKTLLLVMGNGGFANYAQDLLDTYIDVLVMLYGEDMPIASGDHEWGGIIPARNLEQHRLIRGAGTDFNEVFTGLAKDPRAKEVENIIMFSAFTNSSSALAFSAREWLVTKNLLVVRHSDDANEPTFQHSLPGNYGYSNKFKIITSDQFRRHLTFKGMGV
jgi:hypothetical protein